MGFVLCFIKTKISYSYSLNVSHQQKYVLEKKKHLKHLEIVVVRTLGQVPIDYKSACLYGYISTNKVTWEILNIHIFSPNSNMSDIAYGVRTNQG